MLLRGLGILESRLWRSPTQADLAFHLSLPVHQKSVLDVLWCWTLDIAKELVQMTRHHPQHLAVWCCWSVPRLRRPRPAPVSPRQDRVLHPRSDVDRGRVGQQAGDPDEAASGALGEHLERGVVWPSPSERTTE